MEACAAILSPLTEGMANAGPWGLVSMLLVCMYIYERWQSSKLVKTVADMLNNTNLAIQAALGDDDE
jgi:F0F1-type ATP synthase assembly protein I